MNVKIKVVWVAFSIMYTIIVANYITFMVSIERLLGRESAGEINQLVGLSAVVSVAVVLGASLIMIFKKDSVIHIDLETKEEE